MFKRLLGVSVLVIVTLMLVVSVSAQDQAPVATLPTDSPFAAFIDSRNFAIAQGATAEWRKLEWVALDANNSKIYFAVTDVGAGMADAEGDIQMTENPCGAVFQGDLDANFNVSSVHAVLVGGPLDATDSCPDDGIANPDNLYVDSKGNLWIGEDSGEPNEALWMWNGTDLKRFATVPAGAEVTGVHVTPDGTVFMNVQHPDETNPEPYNMGLVGVITGYVAGDDFEGLPVPAEGEVADHVIVAAGEYQVLARVGDPFPGAAEGAPVYGAIVAHDGVVMDVCNNPDGNMFLPSGENTANLYSNMECGVGGVARLALERDAAGNWMVTGGDMVDFVPVDGTESNCGASVTSWGTGLTSEEYPPDNDEDWAYWLEEQQAGLTAYTGKTASPFDIGYNVELIPSDSGTEVVKHYAMGRFSKEVGVVMPDNMTVYFGDDGTDRVLFKFIADAAGDLSAGTLYAAKVTQDGDALNLEWIELGHGTDAEIYAAVRALDAQFAS